MWQSLVERAATRGELVGVNAKRYPRDFAALVRYHKHLRRRLKTRPHLPVLSLERANNLLSTFGGSYGVEIED